MPNPILKRARSDAAPHTVHFSPALTRTFTAHPRSEYDRSPIVVSPNACALPARGCPGRTYYDNAPRRSSKHTPQQQQPPRGHLHPRALQNPQYDDDEDDDDDDEVERTPTRTSPYIALPVPPPIPQPPTYMQQMHPPALVPDLSSESDESSDGFASPPPEPANVPFVGGKYPYTYALPYNQYPYPYPNPTAYPPPFSIPPSSLSAFSSPPYPPPGPSYPHAAPAAPYPPSASPSFTRSSTPPATRRARRPTAYARGATPTQEDGYEEEDLPGSHTHAAAFSLALARASPPKGRRPRSRERVAGGRSTPTPTSPTRGSPPAFAPAPSSPPRERTEKPRRKDKGEKKAKAGSMGALCRTLKGASFRDAEGDGCLGGF